VSRRIAAVAGVLVVALGAWWLWPTDRRRIIAAGRELAQAASIPVNEPDLARVTRAAVLSRLLAPGVRLVGPTGRVGIDGREAALGLATRLRPPRGLTVTIDDLDPSFSEDGTTATSRTVVTLREPAVGEAPDSVDRREVETTWMKGEAWQLSQLTVLTEVEGDSER
jgi:hypothetical protein